MYKVALIQNQTEMSHYSYADAWPFLKGLNYETYLYTAENISELSHKIKDLEFDAVIFGSNALNDKTIRSEVLSKRFRDRFLQFLKEGKGCLILHQLKLAQSGVSGEGSNFQFLPGKLGDVKPISRPTYEGAKCGELYKEHDEQIINEQLIWLYPNDIDLANIKNQCLSFTSLEGLYWHYWDKVDNCEWDINICDKNLWGKKRPLIISSKKEEKCRIVLSSLMLDWQKQEQLLENILCYVVEGRHLTAVLTKQVETSLSFNYLKEILHSRKYPFKQYCIDEDKDIKLVTKNIKNQIHTIVLLDPSIDKKDLESAELDSLIKDKVDGGSIKLIGIDPFKQYCLDKDLKLVKKNIENQVHNNGSIKLVGTKQQRLSSNIFFVAGRENFPLQLLYDEKTKLEQELKSNKGGYIDDSFWETVESLQTLNRIEKESKRKPELNIDIPINTFKRIKTHDKNGSYDETFAASCALLWLKETYLHSDSKDTERTLNWIKERLNNKESSNNLGDREKVLAYSILIDTKISPEDQEDYLLNLTNLLQAQYENICELNEYDSVVFLHAAIQTKMTDLVKSMLNHLKKLQQNGHRTDLATTAAIAIEAMDALELLKENDSAPVNASIELMIFNSIINIQTAMSNDKHSESVTYPLGGKASISLKCIHALLKFENLVDLPISEMIGSLRAYSNTGTQVFSSKILSKMLERCHKDNLKLSSNNARLKTEVGLFEWVRNNEAVFWIVLFIIAYLILSVIIYLCSSGKLIETILSVLSVVLSVLEKALLDEWRLHLTILAALGFFGWIKYGLNKEKIRKIIIVIIWRPTKKIEQIIKEVIERMFNFLRGKR